MPDRPPTPATLRAAAWQSLATRTSLQAAILRLGFVQADPIRAPARAQDLTLMQRVAGYRAGDLERRYPTLDVEEDIIQNYGFVPRRVQRLLHPREVGVTRIEHEHPELLDEVRAMLAQRTEVHPREVAALLGRGSVGNAWGGQSSATTRALDALHYRGEARVTRRVAGVRVYGPALHLHTIRQAPLPEEERLRGTAMLLAHLYGPLPEASFKHLISLSRFGLPHLHGKLREVARQMMREELGQAKVEGVSYVWPREWTFGDLKPPKGVKIVGPFDPLVWDRRRFQHLHGWPYRFEAYTPAAKRSLGYYALPVFQADKAIGWANLRIEGTEWLAKFGWAAGVRETARLRRGLNAELDRYRVFLGLAPSAD